MSKLFKAYEVAEFFDFPKPTVTNWSKEKGTWRARLYKILEKAMVAELSKRAEKL